MNFKTDILGAWYLKENIFKRNVNENPKIYLNGSS